MKILSFTGQDAIDVAMAANRQTEEFDGKAWRPSFMWNARRVASREPEKLRLRGPARLLAEAVVGRAIPTVPGMAIADQVRVAHAAMLEPDKTQTVRAVALLLNALEDDGV